MSQNEDLSHLILDNNLTNESQAFLAELKVYSKTTGATVKSNPIFLNREVNLLGLYQAVTERGGYHKFCETSSWKKFTPPGEQQTKASSLVRVIYKKYLLSYERDHFKGYPRLSVRGKDQPEPSKQLTLQNVSLAGKNADLTYASHLKEDLNKFYHNPMDVQLVYNTKRIALALESGLPNEVEWGFEALLRWSYACPSSYSMENFPYLSTVLLDEFSKNCDQLNSVLLRRSGTLVPMPFLLLALGIRNCLLCEDSAIYFAETSLLTEQLTQLLMLPRSIPPLIDAANYPELRTYCADMLDSMGTYITPSNSFLDWLGAGIMSDDRSQVLGGLRLMTKIMLGKHDKALELALDHDKFLRHVFALLTLPDDVELHSVVIEFLILYSYFLPNELESCVTQFPFLVNSLLGLLLSRQSQIGEDVLAERCDNLLVHIENWLRERCESNPLYKISALELFSEYMRDSVSRRLPPLTALKLIRVARMTFPGSQIMQFRQNGKNLFFLTKLGRKGEGLVFDAPAPSKPKLDGGFPCLWGTCTTQLANKFVALEHIKNVHMPDLNTLYCCGWQNCKDSFATTQSARGSLLTHARVHVHFFQPSVPEASSNVDPPAPPRNVVPPQQAVPSGANNLLELLVDLLKRLASFPTIAPAFMPHYSTLLNVAASVPFLSKDVLQIIDLVTPGVSSGTSSIDSES